MLMDRQAVEACSAIVPDDEETINDMKDCHWSRSWRVGEGFELFGLCAQDRCLLIPFKRPPFQTFFSIILCEVDTSRNRIRTTHNVFVIDQEGTDVLLRLANRQ